MNLYFLSNYNETEDEPTSTRELFVRSETVEAAIDLWRVTYMTPEADLAYLDPDDERIIRDTTIPNSIWVLNPDTVGVLTWGKPEGAVEVRTSRYHAINEAAEALGVEP